MSVTSPDTPGPRRRTALVLGLLAVSGLAPGVSLLLAFTPWAPALAPAGATALQFANVVLSSLALALAAGVAWRHRRRAEAPSLDQWITVCAWTRRVHWHGRWITFEEYLARRFNLRCTHGICEEAAAHLRQELARGKVPAELPRG